VSPLTQEKFHLCELTQGELSHEPYLSSRALSEPIKKASSELYQSTKLQVSQINQDRGAYNQDELQVSQLSQEELQLSKLTQESCIWASELRESFT
jgi:hypothetical protein